MARKNKKNNRDTIVTDSDLDEAAATAELQVAVASKDLDTPSASQIEAQTESKKLLLDESTVPLKNVTVHHQLPASTLVHEVEVVVKAPTLEERTEPSSKCCNPRVYEAMRLKSGKLVTPAATISKKKSPLDEGDVAGISSLSELLEVEKLAEQNSIDKDKIGDVSDKTIESVSAPVGQVSASVKSVSEGGGFESGSSVAKPVSEGVTDTLGLGSVIEQGTQTEVDPGPIANKDNVAPVLIAPAGVGSVATSGDFLGPNALKAADEFASWVQMVKKNRELSDDVVILTDHVDCINQDTVFLEEEDTNDDSMEKLSLIGIFPSKFPGRDAVQKIVNAWPRKCRYHYHNSGWIVFVFEQEADLTEVLQAGPFYAFGKPLLLKKMPVMFDFSKDACTTVPVWIQLPNLPLRLWKDRALSKICSFLGSPQYTDKVTATKKVLSFARCLVEIDLKMELPSVIPITMHDGKVLKQPVFYEERPKFCSKCNKLGHNEQGHDDSKGEVPALYVAKSKKPGTSQPKTSKKKKVIVLEDDGKDDTTNVTAPEPEVHSVLGDKRISVSTSTKGKEVEETPVANVFDALDPDKGSTWASEAEAEDFGEQDDYTASGAKNSRKKKKNKKKSTAGVSGNVGKRPDEVSRGKAPLGRQK